MHNNNNIAELIKQSGNLSFFISNESIDFSESIWIFSIFFYVFQNTVLWKKNETITVQLLVQSPDIWYGILA